MNIKRRRNHVLHALYSRQVARHCAGCGHQSVVTLIRVISIFLLIASSIFANAQDEIKMGEKQAAQEQRPSTNFTLELEDRAVDKNPTQQSIFTAVDALTPNGGPGFLIIDKSNGDYAQAAGGDERYMLELREYNEGNFIHYAAGKGHQSEVEVVVPMNGFHVIVRENEVLDADDLKNILSDFYKSKSRSEDYIWRDKSNDFK